MFLHLGGDLVIPKKDIVAILDFETSLQAVGTKKFFKTALNKGLIKDVVKNSKEKSLVITNKNIYLSPISSATLMKRNNHTKELIKDLEIKDLEIKDLEIKD